MNSKQIISTAVMSVIALSPMFAAAQTPTVTTPSPVVAYNGTCAKTEFLRHEGVLSLKRSSMDSLVKSLESKKQNAIAESFLITDEAARMLAMKTAEQDFKKGIDALKTEAEKTAMKTEEELFKTNMKACGVVGKGMGRGMGEGMKKGFEKMKDEMKDMFKSSEKDDNEQDGSKSDKTVGDKKMKQGDQKGTKGGRSQGGTREN